MASRVKPRPGALTRGRGECYNPLMNLGLPELLVILAIIILVFGANRLPDLGKGIGKAIRNFRDATSEAKDKHD